MKNLKCFIRLFKLNVINLLLLAELLSMIISYLIYNNSIVNVSNQSVQNSTYVQPSVTVAPTLAIRNINEVSRGNIDRSKKSEKVDKLEYVDSFMGSITMYSLHVEDCGKTEDDVEYGITYSGKRVQEGVTVAAGREIPLGSKIRIEGFDGIYTVLDRGGGVKFHCIDVFTHSKIEADRFGRQKRMVYIISYGNGKV